MAVLVTGGAGYIGSHMVWELLDAGERVVVVDNLSKGFDWAVAPEALLVKGDIADSELVGGLIRKYGIDAVIHFAGSIVVPESVADPLGYYRNNTVNSRALIECAVRGGVKHFIFSSTAAVYGNPAQAPVGEDAPLAPMSPYGSSKLMTEIMLHDVATAYGLNYVVLRYFNVAGADPQARIGLQTVGATHLLKIAVEAATGQRAKMEVFGTDYPTPDGTCIRDYIHVTDLARAHIAALAYLRRGGASTTFNCGYGHGYSVLEVLAAARRISGNEFPVDFADRRAGDPASLVADVSRIQAELDWRPMFDDLEIIISHALAWERRLMANNGAP